ncbi:Protein of unknown function [Gryllus bimaculatus]|nr:Protein of unknown function [Gryllus bimaculatus]
MHKSHNRLQDERREETAPRWATKPDRPWQDSAEDDLARGLGAQASRQLASRGGQDSCSGAGKE